MQATGTAPSKLSVAEATKAKAAPLAPVASTVALAGTVTTGGVASITVTVNDAVPVLPWASVAVQVTMVAPTANVDPLAGAQVTGTTPSTRSVAEATKAWIAPLEPCAGTVSFAGTVTTGPVVSVTVTVNDA